MPDKNHELTSRSYYADIVAIHQITLQRTVQSPFHPPSPSPNYAINKEYMALFSKLDQFIELSPLLLQRSLRDRIESRQCHLAQSQQQLKPLKSNLKNQRSRRVYSKCKKYRAQSFTRECQELKLEFQDWKRQKDGQIWK
jgi:hypothetical protein